MRRFGKTLYRSDTDQVTTGFYNAAFKILYDWAKEIKENKALTFETWTTLSDNEKRNLKRAGTEIATWVFIVFAIQMLGHGGDDDDDETWGYRALMYHFYRMRYEL